MNKGTQLCSHENSVPFPATSNVPAGLPDEGSCARGGHKFVQHLMDEEKKNPQVGKVLFISFSFQHSRISFMQKALWWNPRRLSLPHPRWEPAHLNDRKSLEG